MASQLLVNVFLVGPLAPLASVTLPHGLKVAGKGVVPTQVMPNLATPIVVGTVDDTTAQFINQGTAPAFAVFRCEYDHSIHAVGAAPLYWQGVSGAGPAFASVYGAFSDSTDQTIPQSPASLAVQFNTVDAAGGVTVVNNGSGKPTRLTVPTTGVYKFDISPQLFHGGGGTEIIQFWAAIDGTPVANSTSSLEMGNNNNRTLPFLSLIASLNAGQYLEWFFNASGGTSTTLEAYAAAGAVPANPSVIANVQRIA